jgi:hypothetical protein
VLRASRIVATRRQAREIEYSPTDGHVAHIALDTTRHAQEQRGVHPRLLFDSAR